MRTRIIIVGLSLLISSCGGGSNEPTSGIEGTWKGDLIQGVILCSDGTGIGAGGGSTIREVTLEVSGSDEIGSIVQAVDGNCLLEGPRTADGFRADPVSGCDQELDFVNFTILEEDRAALKYHNDISKAPAGPTGIHCTISPDATMERQ